MKPEFTSRRLFGITRSKGKMYELGLPENLHISVPENSEPKELFLLTIGTLGDVAAILSDAQNVDEPLPLEMLEELSFSASFFDAFLESRFSEDISYDTSLLAASAYYLARRPGSSLVLARKLVDFDGAHPVDKLLHWVLQAQWDRNLIIDHPFFGRDLAEVPELLAMHFTHGIYGGLLPYVIKDLRIRAYEGATARELLFIDIISAIVRMRLAASAWTTLPGFTGIPAKKWATAIRRSDFPKELWPSQMLLGQAGLFSGASGIVQMPTSAGKTRSLEIVLRSGFLSGRTKLAVVVAPFRALCHEIGTSLRHAFREDDVKVNELSDALQLDFMQQIAEFLGMDVPNSESQYILVLTPEKLLYVLRQTPSLANSIGIVIYDEGHQFDTGTRGITYELLLTEIKALLPTDAQTVLVSAVIQNAKAIAQWLMGDDAQVVNGSGLLPTARSIAFASWVERLGQLMFFESESYIQPDYFVPRVIEQQKLAKLPGERAERYFPAKNSSNDVALYLGFRLASQGAVAIFCGRKDTASGMASRAVEVYERELAIVPPAAFANQDELRRLKNLVDGYFGDQSVTSRAASLGVFVHHGNTPHGIRLSIEYAMQKGLINFVACTSTLAQGVNLPIRYLIISGIHQAGEKIKVRDFQNLVGRAGRSGMHTEGLVIFSDPSVYDTRRTNSWHFDLSVELLSPDRAESTTSSLLGLMLPIQSGDGKVHLPMSANELCKLMLSDEAAWLVWANEIVSIYPKNIFNVKELITELRNRRRLIFAIESYLMANRGSNAFDVFKTGAEQLATATLAYHLASDEVKLGIGVLFETVVEYVQQQEPSTEKQAVYAKTLLGVRSAKAIERWVAENRDILLSLTSSEEWLMIVWELFIEQSDDKFFHTVEPQALAFQIARRWLQGSSYRALFEYVIAEKGTKSWGEKARRKLNEDDIIDFCESELGFQCTLVLAAVAQFLFGDTNIFSKDASVLTLFQKSLKYGMPDSLSISCYEYGFSDRVLAQHIGTELLWLGYFENIFGPAIEAHRDRIQEILSDYPSYFKSVLAGLNI